MHLSRSLPGMPQRVPRRPPLDPKASLVRRATPLGELMPTGLPWDDPNSDPLGDILEFLDREIADQPNPLLRKPLERWREEFGRGRDPLRERDGS